MNAESSQQETPTRLRTIDLAVAAGIGVQQVRNYEACGFIPAAVRSPSGYRLYTQRHREAILTARRMIAGYGWQSAQAILQAFHHGDLVTALARLDACHARLTAQRSQVAQARSMVSAVAGHELPVLVRPQTQGLTIGEAAAKVGVRPSAVRHWEAQGLLHPIRDGHSAYRHYDAQQFRRLQIIVLLRDMGYDQNAIRPVLDELAAGRLDQVQAAVEQRAMALHTASQAALEAAAAFWQYVNHG